MTTPYSIQDVRNITLWPHAGQFVIDELPLIFMCMAGLVYGGMEGMPLGSMATVIALFLFLVLLYRFICLRRDTLPGRRRTACLRAGAFLP